MKFNALLFASAAILGTTNAFVAPRPITAISSSSTSLDATIAVFGASGLTAQECVYQALKDGDTVVGLTRNPSNVVVPKGLGGSDAEKPITDPNLTVIAGKKLYALDIVHKYAQDIVNFHVYSLTIWVFLSLQIIGDVCNPADVAKGKFCRCMHYIFC